MEAFQEVLSLIEQRPATEKSGNGLLRLMENIYETFLEIGDETLDALYASEDPEIIKLRNTYLKVLYKSYHNENSVELLFGDWGRTSLFVDFPEDQPESWWPILKSCVVDAVCLNWSMIPAIRKGMEADGIVFDGPEDSHVVKYLCQYRYLISAYPCGDDSFITAFGKCYNTLIGDLKCCEDDYCCECHKPNPDNEEYEYIFEDDEKLDSCTCAQRQDDN